MTAPAAKRVRLTGPERDESVHESSGASSDEGGEGTASDASGDSLDSESADEDTEGQDGTDTETGVTDDDEEAIRGANRLAHEKKPRKRRRALSPDSFGAALNALLDAPPPTAKQIASLHRPAKKALKEEAIERKALRIVQQSKQAHRERGHVTDVIANWPARPAIPFRDWPSLPPGEAFVPGGAEAERALRRLAQKGVVKLFNAIKAAQGATPENGGGGAASAASTTASKKRKGVKEETPSVAGAARDTEASPAPKPVKGHNLLGAKGKEQALANLSRDSFLSILKAGGTTRSSAAA